jgi:ubiquinone/menaquinone biosynthesis C-methylase UbiE
MILSYSSVNIKTIENARKDAISKNIKSDYAKNVMNLFVCPKDKKKLTLQGDHFICEFGHKVPIINGIPDFITNSENMTEDKLKQAAFHDDEEINERFDEIVLRPYNYNKVHIKSWLFHLIQLKKILPSKLNIDLKNTSILNCGCGGGFEAQFLAENGALVTGFDISQLRAEASSTRFALSKLIGFFYRGDAASSLPFPDNSFDLVLYHDSLHHVPIEGIPLAIREAVRVAKRGAIFMECHDSPLTMLLESIGLSTSIEASGNYVFRLRKSLMQFFSFQTSTQLVNYSTFLMKKEHRPKYYAIPIVNWVLYYLIRFGGFFLKPFGNEACIILKKANNP